MKTCAIYARVSTPEEQVDAQLVELRRAAQQRGYTVIAEFSDVGGAALKARRPGLDSLLRDARKHGFPVVMCEGYNRIARSSKHLFQLVGEFDHLGIEFVSLRKEIDTGTPAGRLFISHINLLSDLEADLVGERIRAGMRRRRLEGFRLGRQPLAVERQALVHDRLSGMSLTQVARKYSVSRASVVRFCREGQRRQMGAIAVGLMVQGAAGMDFVA